MSALERAVEQLGGPAAAARALGVTTQAVIFWIKGERKFPAEQCIALEEATGGAVKAEELRPDVSWHVIRDNPAPEPAP